MGEVRTYRSIYDPRPAPLPALFRPVSTDLGDPARFHVPFDPAGMRWGIIADDAGRSWQVPLFHANGEALWHWGQIRKRNQRGYADGIGPYLAAERKQMADVGLTYQPDLWLTMGRIAGSRDVPADQWSAFTGAGTRRETIYKPDNKWQAYRHDMGQWAMNTWMDPGMPDPSSLSNVHNDSCTLILKGSKVWARCNPWLRIAMPYGMPGEVASDSAAWNALQTLKGALEIIAGYLTDNVMMISHGIYDIIETWYDYATAGARELAADAAINDQLRHSAGDQGLARGALDGSIGGRKRPTPVITWTPRKKARR